MKKIVSIMLMTVLLLSLVVTPVFAQSSNLINDTLQEQLDALNDDDKLSVWVWIYSAIDVDEIEHQALVETGLLGESLDTNEEIDAYRRARTRLMSEFHKAENQAVLDKIGVPDEDIIFFSTLTPSFIITITKSKVYEIAQMEEIASIDYYYVGPVVEPTEPPYKPIEPVPIKTVRERFEEEYSMPETFRELYNVYSDELNTQLDWALIEAFSGRLVEPTEIPTVFTTIVENVVFSTVYYYDPFETPYCIYDAQKDEFIAITKVNFDEYEGLREVFCSGEYGILVGDLDADKEVTVIDASKIQRIVAGLEQIDIFAVADFNGDKSVDVLDATSIQRKLANLASPTVYNEDLVFVSYSDKSYYPQGRPQMPPDYCGIAFEDVYSKSGIYDIENYVNADYYNEDFLAVIKTKEQYDEIFKVENDVYDEEFFENNYLLAALYTLDCDEADGNLYDVAVMNKTMYVKITEIVDPGSGISPTTPRFVLLTKLEKDQVKSVTDIEWT
ncbi:MAG: dockerin type I repeat-containing protein [Ruminococcus sp.]|nr:dockerin type I repeat-containing protein [Ruminococcus sp.]